MIIVSHYCSIAVITAGKYELVLQEGALRQLVVLLHDDTPSVRLNAAKVQSTAIAILIMTIEHHAVG